MSTSKRRGGSDAASPNNGEHQSASLLKRRRLSPIGQPDNGVNPNVVRTNGYRAPSAPMQPFREQRSFRFRSEGARPPNRNKRVLSPHWQPSPYSSPFSPNSFPYSCPPEMFDVSPWLRDAIPPDDDEMYFWEDAHTAFINSANGLENLNWIGKRPLGAGTFGTAGLWERRDENNALIEQMVIKESKTIPVEHWTGQVPEEVKMMQSMNTTKCRAVPELLAYKRYPHVRKHRIYMEFCPYSDLATLNSKYQRFRTYFPEPFLWHTFNNLVKVAAAMENGPEYTKWNYQIVHRDLKPANIFLGLEDEVNGFRTYPVAKTGDWGLGVKIKHGDRRNPIGLRGAGTDAYNAPEQKIPNSGDRAQETRHLNGTSPTKKLSAHTNVWGIGAIMFELLTHEGFFHYLDNPEWTVDGVIKDIPNVRNPRYSGALTELIKLCLMPDPWDRPRIEELDLKIGTRCQSIMDAYAANPSLQQKERLYYKGSEIRQMPPGNWNYWNPVVRGVVLHPSDEHRFQEIFNPFTNVIEYPRFLTSESSDSEDDESEERDVSGEDSHEPRSGEEDGKDDETRSVPRGDSVRKPLIVSDDSSSSPRGEDARNPIIVSDSNGEHGMKKRTTVHGRDQPGESNSREQRSGTDENNESKGSSRSEQSTSSDDSETRRRRGIKKLPGT